MAHLVINQSDDCMPGVDSWTIIELEGSGILEAGGRGEPVDGVRGFLPGCTYKNVLGGPGTTFYNNKGSVTSADWLALS